MKPTYNFPVLRGTQAGREFFLATCPLKLVPKLFLYDEEQVPVQLRAQRTLNKARIPEIAHYITEHPREYVFSAITASIGDQVEFQPLEEAGSERNLGTLSIPMDATIIINDGQHRRAAIEEALKLSPELAEESIAVVFFIDPDLQRSQQMFADLNKHAVRPTKSLGILYDHRDPLAGLCRRLIKTVSLFRGLTEVERTSISNRSTKLFTLSSIYQATKELLKKRGKSPEVSEEDEKLAVEYWTALGVIIPEWRLAKEKRVSTAELRREFIHTHGVALHALGRAGADLITQHPGDWQDRLKALATIDWTRTNLELWDGRAIINGRVSKSKSSIMLTVNVIKTTLGLPLSPEEQRNEKKFRQRQNALLSDLETKESS